MKNSIIGYPRIGGKRELKFNLEKYFNGDMTFAQLNQASKELRCTQWRLLKSKGLDFIPSNDFSFYDGMLDMAADLNIVPEYYKSLGLDDHDTYFAMARGYQGEKGDVRALPMKKWFNTNYHYIVPAIYDDTVIKLNGQKIFKQYLEALELGIKTNPVIIGPLTLLKLSQFKGRKGISDYIKDAVTAYQEIFEKLNQMGADWIQIDEPILVTDLYKNDIDVFASIYAELLKHKGSLKILLQTYFGDVRDCYGEICSLGFDGIGLDFFEGKKSLSLIQESGFPESTVLFAGVVNGKNIWRNNYKNTIELLLQLSSYVNKENIVINTSCSLLHVPYTLENEADLSDEYKKHFSFAEEKLDELNELKALFENGSRRCHVYYAKNQELFSARVAGNDLSVKKRIKALRDADFIRTPCFNERKSIQKTFHKLPLLPTTTIGSFPQTKEVKADRTRLKKGDITKEQYESINKERIKEWITLQEELGIDVLVHGEFERNDMVEYFGEQLKGYLFTQNAWVQSYGTRCVKPPVIWGDVSRTSTMTVEYSKYAQSLSEKPVKGMLTGPVTILNWSFPREDISLREMAFQIALAIKDEVSDLEDNGINIIQIDEAALKEKLPIRKSDWYVDYLAWAVPAFRLVHSRVKATTQIHTHMCYSEFEEIIQYIGQMDADVISFEASRSEHSIIGAIKRNNFITQVGPGVYDIHSPRVPGIEELTGTIKAMLGHLDIEQLWINPDCGLKTRGVEETLAALKNMVAAAENARRELL